MSLVAIRQQSGEADQAGVGSRPGLADELGGLSDGLRLDPAGHAGDLSAAAAAALRAGSFAQAFALADRRCRIRPPADAHDHLLRAAALRGLGDPAEAEAEIRRAGAIEPENRIAARWLLQGSPEDRARAARVLLQIEREPARIAEAIAAIDTPALRIVGAFSGTPEGVEGWIAWRGAPAVSLLLCVDDVCSEVVIAPEPDHPLAGVLGHAARCRWPWSANAETIALRAVGDGALILGTAFSRPAMPVRSPVRRAGWTGSLSVIVPVYEDLDATRICFDTLLEDEPRTLARKIVAVDDRTPDPKIAALLDQHGSDGRIAVIRNAVNLGFARSVNRALARRTGGDVLILNADTVLPPGSLDRLARAAYSAPDIGTVTPISNNGENTSFPRPFVVNELPPYREICAIDEAARDANPGLVVDMPNGTGFCLYVRGDCLDAIGPLSTAFGRGYLEDSEFCLRASAAGFRSVCAADVFVGHAGGRSFGDDKRALVVRNLKAIEAQYPGYERACAAFFDADPLAGARAAIELRRLAGSEPAALLVHGAADDPLLVGQRVELLVRDSPDLLVGRAALRAGRLELAIRRASGGAPQSIRVTHDVRDDASALADALRALPLKSIAFLDRLSLPRVLVDTLQGLGLPDLVAEEAWPTDRPATGGACSASPRSAGPGRLAILAPPPGVSSFRTLRAIVRHWSSCTDLPSLVVVGESLDDARLIGSGDVWVTGPVTIGELPALLDRVNAARLVLPVPTPSGHPHRQLALESGLPTAYAADSGAPASLDGEIDASLPEEDFAAALAAWARDPGQMAAAA